ncbi:proline and serine-rich protein 2-like [Xyrauchen texanus]|uniref:proline and serine-rich protein 2-like n=1 Tax=Xyrauchen texanus TaxID=154827 RepID=UPI002241C55C|nr:proline and serine-rich protein 2-like [Xyrauchen texanus]
MDVHVHNSGTLHYRLNNYQNTHTVQDDLQFLSMEERECILFFEETIGMLEEELEDDGARISREVHPVPITVRLPSPGDHDIIDLVHPTPEPSKHTDTLPAIPDFQELVGAPETPFEVKAKQNPMENSPSELTIATPVAEEGGHRPPPGSVPTPVVIASNIAEHQGPGGALPLPSMLNQRRHSLELPQNTSAKHGPPTHAKPMHLPDNISLMIGSREHVLHSIAAEAVSVQERRAQMLANLPGSAHPLEGGEPVCVRNLPIRSVSFRDLMPDKSRMEALSKLGLMRNRAQSVMYPSPRDSNAEGISFKTNANTVQTTFKSDNGPIHTCNASSRVHAPNSSSSLNAPNIAFTTNKAINNNVTSTVNIVADVPTTTHGMDTKDHCQTNTVTKQDNSRPSPALTSAEVTHSDFNSYGGKSITLNPTMTFWAEYIPPQSATAISSPKTEAQEVHLNSFGGWSRVMNPSVAHRDEPDGYSSYSHSLPSQISHLNNHGAQSKTLSSVEEDYSTVSPHPGRRTTDEDVSTIKVTSSHSEAPSHPVVTRQPPTPAPKPSRRSSPLSPTRPRLSPPSLELRHKPAPKSSFRSQGITVQFSGKGATNEARRDALRKLGLLRDTS